MTAVLNGPFLVLFVAVIMLGSYLPHILRRTPKGPEQ